MGFAVGVGRGATDADVDVGMTEGEGCGADWQPLSNSAAPKKIAVVESSRNGLPWGL